MMTSPRDEVRDFRWSDARYNGPLSFGIAGLFVLFVAAVLAYGMVENLAIGITGGFKRNFYLVNFYDVIGSVYYGLIGAVVFRIMRVFFRSTGAYLASSVAAFLAISIYLKLQNGSIHNFSLYSDGKQKFVDGTVTMDGFVALAWFNIEIVTAFVIVLALAAYTRRKWRSAHRNSEETRPC